MKINRLTIEINKKTFVGLVLAFFLVSMTVGVFAPTVSHRAEQIIAGVFGQQYSGNWSFINGSVGVGTDSPETLMHIKSGDSGETPNSVSGLFVESAGVAGSSYTFQVATAGGGKSFSVANDGDVCIGGDCRGAWPGTSVSLTNCGWVLTNGCTNPLDVDVFCPSGKVMAGIHALYNNPGCNGYVTSKIYCCDISVT